MGSTRRVLSAVLLLLAACVALPDTDTDLQQAIAWYTGATGQVDDARASALLERAAASGDSLAVMWMARVYSTGRMGFPRDQAQARRIGSGVIEQVQRLADRGHAEASFLMGTAYAEGLGRPVDAAAAARWYERAAVRGNMLAQHNMGNIYAAGVGVPRDDAQAVHWWLQAAAQGDAIPQYRLGEMYERGQGVSTDLDEALRWYRDSAARGYPQAQAALERLAN